MEKKIIVLLALIMVLTSIAGCTADPQIEPPQSEVITPEVVLETMPAATPTPTPTAAATPVIEVNSSYDYIDSLEITKEFAIANLYVDHWLSNETFDNHDKGLGMWIPSRKLIDGYGSDTISFALNGLYKEMQFDLFTDSSENYGNVDEFGSYQIKIYADNFMIYESATMYCDGLVNDARKILPANTMELTIELIQTKGKYGTLDTVIGDFMLYHTDAYAATLSANPTPLPISTLESPPERANVWINVEALYLRSRPDIGEKKLDKIPYGYSITGYKFGNWLYISFDGIDGYIYIKELSSGRASVVDKQADLQPLD